MAYEWTTGETITAAKLNATGGGLVTPVFTEPAPDTFTCDMTFAQIQTAIQSNSCLAAKLHDDVYLLYTHEEDEFIGFMNFNVSSYGISRTCIGIESDNSISKWEEQYPE